MHLVLPYQLHIEIHTNTGSRGLGQQRLINKAKEMAKNTFSPELRQHMRTFQTLVSTGSGSPAQCPFCSALGKAFPTRRPFRFDWTCRWVFTKEMVTPFLKDKTSAFDVHNHQSIAGKAVLSPAHILLFLSSLFSCSLMVRQVFCFPRGPPVSLISLPGLSHTWAEEHCGTRPSVHHSTPGLAEKHSLSK